MHLAVIVLAGCDVSSSVALATGTVVWSHVIGVINGGIAAGHWHRLSLSLNTHWLSYVTLHATHSTSQYD